MKRVLLSLMSSMLAAGPALAALPVGSKAPDFDAQASLGGKEFTFSLADARKRGPVVVYFYPKAFTPGCTIEAHEFAASMDQFKALHASVIGVSHDDIAALDKFSISECQSKFPVAADPNGAVIASYDAKMALMPAMSDRISYVIAPDGHVLYSFTDRNPDKHVENTLGAIKAWNAAHGG